MLSVDWLSPAAVQRARRTRDKMRSNIHRMTPVQPPQYWLHPVRDGLRPKRKRNPSELECSMGFYGAVTYADGHAGFRGEERESRVVTGPI